MATTETQDGAKAKKQPQQNSAQRAPILSLPKGGGALKSIDEKFSVNPVNGTSTLSVPLPFSRGRAGGPGHGLQYSSGGGNGVYGLGWTLDLPGIQRRTDKALPRYRDGDDGDIFLLAGAEDLTPVFRKTPADAWEADADTVGNVSVRRYRPRMEGLFARIEQIRVTGQAGFYWKVTTRDNVATFYGLTPAGRIADPDDDTRIFKWLPELTYDDKGNCFEYVYKNEDLSSIPESIEEQHRRNGLAPVANVYLKRILYGNKTPYYPSPATPWQPAPPTNPGYFFEAVWDYGEHDALTPTPAETGAWACRTDPFSDYRAGFEIRTWRLCRRILFFHRFAELNLTPGPVLPTLVQSIDFTYQHLGFNNAPYVRQEADFITAIHDTFYKRNGAGYGRKSLPPLEMDYHPLAWNKAVQTVAPEDVMNAPTGGAGAGYQFVDLYGEGVSGILTEQANAWYYKSNLGDGHFSRAAPVLPKPSFTGVSSGALQIQDLNGDGSKQVVVNAPGMAGYFEFSDDGQWQPFVAFGRVANVPSGDPNGRFIDLNGDGKADLLITEEQVLRWYPSLGKEGYDEAELWSKSFDEERGPAVLFADGAQTIFLADINGDGLTDIVRIRNADVCYWPNLGYGRFGAKVTMRNAPLFDAPDHFDPSAIRLFDVSGTGAADLIYLGQGGFTAWINLAGNAWSDPQAIDPFPGTENTNKISVLDLLGNGTGCVVWSSEQPAQSLSPLRYVDLMGGRKPYILSGYRNNLGAETRVEYKSSSYYYLRDKNEGAPWVTRLPFPSMCVSRHEHRDAISGTRLMQEYRYRHGYYDHTEREFRGFGMVEQVDTEDFARFSASGASNLVDATVHQAPVRTRSWYHTGAFLNGDGLLLRLRAEYFHNASVPEHTLPDTVIEGVPVAGLTTEERRQAIRACKGRLLRQEVYADDGSPEAALPYSTADHNFQIRLLQPQRGHGYAVFMVHDSESVTYHYERHPADPRIAHRLNTLIDDLGNVLESASVTYGRLSADSNLPAEVQQEQARTTVLYSLQGYTNDIRSGSVHRLRLSCESRGYELTGAAPAAALFTRAELRSAFSSAADLGYEAAPTDGLIQRRLLQHQRSLYAANADPHAPLPLGQLESLALSYENLALAFTPALRSALFGARITPAMLTEGHYLSSADYKASGLFPAADAGDAHWASAGTVRYPANPPQHFYLPDRYVDAAGSVTTVRYYADYHLMVDRTEDALGNRVTVEDIDFRLLQPRRTRDINDNLSEARFDIFGLVAGTAVRGKGAEADDLTGFVADLSDAQVSAFLADPAAHGAALLQNASSRFVYSFATQPPFAATIIRETHHQQALADGIPSKLHYAFEYSDGDGHVVMKKLQAEPGVAKHCVVHPDGSYTISEIDTSPARRWVGSGRTVHNNKGNPVLQYEPYFSTTSAYETAQELVETGVTPVLYYDAMGRQIRTRFPDGSVSHVEFDNWRKSIFDQNDNVLASDWYAMRIGGALGPAEQSAAQKSVLHDNTPPVAHFDTHGRVHYMLAHNRYIDRVSSAVVNEFYATRTEFDIEGHPVRIHDARGNAVIRYAYDLLGHEAFTVSMDSGERRSFYDALGKPLYGWDNQGNRFHTIYDILQRPTRHELLKADTTQMVTERSEYGTNRLLNQNGRMLRHHDPSGVVSSDAYDFSGNLLRSTRQFAASPSTDIDWTLPGSVPLEARSFVSTSRYDALKRVIESVSPDGSRTINHYNESNLVHRVEVAVRGAAAQAFITRIDHDAKGKRQRIDYGNGVRTVYTYDPLTFRVRTILTTRSSDGMKLQDLRYTYDTVGNVTAVEDNAQQTAYFNNAVVNPSGSYTYDAVYRLTAATGREQIGLNTAPDPWDALRRNLPHKADGAALQNYLQQYEYDAAGNMRKMVHAAGTGAFTNRWTREFTPATGNNRLTAAQVGATMENFTYDAHGNMLSLPHLPAIHWDADNHLRSADLGGGGVAYYTYDSDGHRTRKVVQRLGGLMEERLYLGTLEIFKRSLNGVVQLERETLHVMDGDRRLAMVDTRIAGTDSAVPQLTRYQYANHLGNATLELDDDGAVISYEEYYPFGNTSFQSVDATREVPAKRYRYIGKERDEETGLYYFGARYYAPWLARWTSADPLGVKDGNNVFAFVHDNPVTFHDPSGTLTWGQWAGIGAAIVVGTVVTVATAGLAGPLVGAAAATVIGGIVGGAAGGAVGEIVEARIDRREAHVLRAAVIGGAAGGLFAGAGAVAGAVARGGGGAAGAVVRSVATRVSTSGAATAVRSAASSVARSSAGRAVASGAERLAGSAAGSVVRAGTRRIAAGLQAIERVSERAGTALGRGIPGTPAARAAASEAAASRAGARLEEIVRTGGPMPSDTRAIGGAIIDVPGYTGPTELRAISGAATDSLGEGAAVVHATTPAARSLPRVTGIRGSSEGAISHINDVEIKLLERIAQDLPEGAAGTIHLTSVRSRLAGSVIEPLPACSACTFNMFQFTGNYPGIQLVSHAAASPVATVPFFQVPLSGAAGAVTSRLAPQP